MVWLKVPHPPAGATTLIVSLGILHEPWHIGVLMPSVFLLVTQGIVIESRAEYLDDLTAAGFTNSSVTFTHKFSPDMHGAIVRAVKPDPSAPMI